MQGPVRIVEKKTKSIVIILYTYIVFMKIERNTNAYQGNKAVLKDIRHGIC